MARNNANMQKLRELRERLAAEIAERERGLDALRNQLRGIDAAIAAMAGVEGAALGSGSRPKRNVKKTVLEVIHESGKSGVTASEVVERAASKGRQLDRGSVSSLLSRFKREGTLTFDGERYYPATTQTAPEPFPGLKVVKAV